MKNKNEELKKKILEISRSLLLEKGFKYMNLRDIADKSGCSLANIYTYFKNKNDIFYNVVKNTYDKIMDVFDTFDYYKYMEMIGLKDPQDVEAILNHNYKDSFFQKSILDFIEFNMENLYILLFRSEGSIFSDFKEKIIIEYSRITQYFYVEIKTRFPGRLNENVSDFLIHNLAVSYINFYSELIMHKIKREDMELYFKEFNIFYETGWKALFNM